MAAAALSLQSSFLGAQCSLRAQAAPTSGRVARRNVAVRAEIDANVVINPSIQKDVPKVADTVLVAELSKPVTVYCRCWRSGTFPLCDGTHVKHNQATGDNVGPLVIKK